MPAMGYSLCYKNQHVKIACLQKKCFLFDYFKPILSLDLQCIETYEQCLLRFIMDYDALLL